jgi:hypothetical protein
MRQRFAVVLLAGAGHGYRWDAGKASQRFPIEPMTTPQINESRPSRDGA